MWTQYNRWAVPCVSALISYSGSTITVITDSGHFVTNRRGRVTPLFRMRLTMNCHRVGNRKTSEVFIWKGRDTGRHVNVIKYSFLIHKVYSVDH
jgi:hypothetical protein